MRENTAWFEFNGQKSSALGVRLQDAHVLVRGEARGSQEEVAGRGGYLWLSDGATEALEIKRKCRAPEDKLRQITAWLSGAGRLRFSREEGAAYEARVIKKIEFRCAVPGANPLYDFDVTFSCQPHPYIWPEAEPITIAASGAALRNPGTAPSEPRLAIYGQGDFAVALSGQQMLFTDIADGIIVDTELQDALTLDEKQLLNNHVSGDFFTIPAGTSAISWAPIEDNENPGSVTKIVITPRWRCL